ncbi:uncharacterized protein LOC143021403 [Oratosquilla oratoria]|uniref:uncharacterized protein LOC143021403 n=1 Tax=Oratosquilla oratoria TaxID=337810 RepID=UPI003F77095C
MEVIPTSRGGSKLCYDNFMYIKKRVYTERIRWDCVKQRKAPCRAFIYTDLNLENPVLIGSHSHDGSAFEVEIARLRVALKEKAIQSEESPKDVMESVFGNLDEEARAKLGSVDSLRRAIWRHRQTDRSRKSSLDKANEEGLVSPKLEISSPVRQEQDFELPDEPTSFANCGTPSHTNVASQQDSLCPVKLEHDPEAFLEVSLSVQEDDDTGPTAVQGKKGRRSRGCPTGVRRKQRKRSSVGSHQNSSCPVKQEPQDFLEVSLSVEEHEIAGPAAVQGKKRQRSRETPGRKRQCKRACPVQERNLLDPVTVQEEQKLMEEVTVQEEVKLMEQVKVKEEHEVMEQVKVQEEQKLMEQVTVQEEHELFELVIVKEEHDLMEPATVQEEQNLMQPVTVQEEQNLVQPVTVQEEQDLMQPVTVQEEQNLVQPVTVQEEQDLMQPVTVQQEAVSNQEHERTSPEEVRGQKQVPFNSDPEPGSPVDSFQGSASPAMTRELQNPEEQEEESGDAMAAQGFCVSPVQDLKGSSSEALGAVQELPCVPEVRREENTSSGTIQELPHLPAAKSPQNTSPEIAPASPYVPAIQQPDSTSSGTFQGLAGVASGRTSPDGPQEFPAAQKMGPDSAKNYSGASLPGHPAVFEYVDYKPFSLAEELQRRLEVVTAERDSLLYAKGKWEEERLLLINQRNYLTSEKAALQQHLDALTSFAPLLLSAQEDWRNWKANIGNESESILSEQVKLYEMKMALEREKEAFLREKTNWEVQIISFQHERDSFYFEKLKWEKERNSVLGQMNGFMCKSEDYYSDSGKE